MNKGHFTSSRQANLVERKPLHTDFVVLDWECFSDGQKVIHLRNPVNFELSGAFVSGLPGGLSERRNIWK